MDEDITVTLKRSNDLLMTFGNDYSNVFLPAIDEIERLREALRHMIRWHDQLSLVDIAKAKAALKEK